MCFLFKLVFSFPYVNSRAGISARAEICPCNQPLNIIRSDTKYGQLENVPCMYVSANGGQAENLILGLLGYELSPEVISNAHLTS